MQAQRKQQGILGRTALRLFASFAVGCLGGTAVPPAKNLFAVILCAVLCFALLSFFCRGGKNRMLCPAVLLGALFFYGAISLGGEFSTPLYALYTALLGIALYLLLSFEKEGNYFRLHRVVGAAVFAGAVLFYLAFYVFCAVYRLKSYSSVCFDFGIFVQMFHSMRQGLGMVTTLERNTLMSHFSVHFSPIYYLFLPFYAVFPAALTLLILQVLTTAASIVPAYLLCREKGLSKAMTGLFCAALLFSPVLGGGCLYDLHENCFLPVLLLWLFYFFGRGKYFPAFLFAALTMCVKEDAPVYLAFAALYFLLSAPRLLQKRARRRQAAAAGMLFLLSVGVFLTVTALMKQFGNGIMSNRYESLIGKQGSLVDLIRIAFTNPDAILRSLCDQGDKITYVLLVLLPLGALPLLTKKWERFVLLCPLVLCNLMPGYEYQHQLFFQYSFGPFAFLAFAAILNLADLGGQRRRFFSMLCVLCSLWLAVGLLPQRAAVYFKYDAQAKKYDAVAAALAALPRDASVSASTCYAVPLAQRSEIYSFEAYPCAYDTEYIVLDLRYEGERDRSLAYEQNGNFEQCAYVPGYLVIYHRIGS